MSVTEITCAAQLHAALTSPDAQTRLDTLEAVVADPRTARAFGLHADRDVIDVLLEQARATDVAAEWLTLVNALSAFADPRVATFFVEVLADYADPSVLFLASDYLAATRARIPRATLARLLLQNDSPARARAAAPLLMRMGVRTPAERLRVALLVDDGPVPPAFADASDAYVAELRGPFVQDARAALMAQGDAAASGLLTHWAALDDATLPWLVEWVVQSLPARAIEEIVKRVLDSGNDQLLRVALTRLVERNDVSIDAPAVALAHCLRHPDPRVRRAAILRSAAPFAWSSLIEIISIDIAPNVRAAATWRLSADFDSRALPRLLDALGDEHWQVRAAAVDALAGLGSNVCSAVRPLVDDARVPVRVAAVDVLLRLGEDAWLAEHLLGGAQRWAR
ncbi:MAG TPA: HEAT repeat domain-containing protein [Casimicrobiaceae bacterium]